MSQNNWQLFKIEQQERRHVNKQRVHSPGPGTLVPRPDLALVKIPRHYWSVTGSVLEQVQEQEWEQELEQAPATSLLF